MTKEELAVKLHDRLLARKGLVLDTRLPPVWVEVAADAIELLAPPDHPNPRSGSDERELARVRAEAEFIGRMIRSIPTAGSPNGLAEQRGILMARLMSLLEREEELVTS
jgi:hypothetical protein